MVNLVRKRERVLFVGLPLAMLAALYCFIATRIVLADGGNAGPDEIARLLVPKAMLSGKLLPSGYDSETILGWGYYSYAFYPQMLGAYVTSAFMAVARLFGASPVMQLYVARLSSVLWGLVGAFFAGKAVATLTSSDKGVRYEYGAIGTLFVGCWPQYAYLSSYVNNDIVGLAGVSVLLCALVVGVKRGWKPSSAAMLVVGIVVCALGYLNTYGFILAGVVTFIVTCLSQHQDNRAQAVRLILLSALACAVCTFPFFVVNIVRYGDVIGSRAFEAQYDRWVAEGGEELLKPYTDGAFSLLFGRVTFVEKTVKSFIGYFGYFSAPLPASFHLFFGGSLLLLTGAFLGNAKYVQSAFCKKWRLFTISVAIACVITVCLHVWRTLTTDYQAQGRYIIDILIPWGIVAVLGGISMLAPMRKGIWVCVALYVLAFVAGMVLTMHLYGWESFIATSDEFLRMVIP